MSDTYECPNCHGRHPYGTICVGPVSDDAAVVQTGLDLAAARAESAQLRADLDEARGQLREASNAFQLIAQDLAEGHRNSASVCALLATYRRQQIDAILAAQPAAGTTCGCEGSCPLCRLGEVAGHVCNRCGAKFCAKCHGVISPVLMPNTPVAPCMCEQRAAVLKCIGELWERRPHERLGQLLVNLAGGDPFYVEDEELARRCEQPAAASAEQRIVVGDPVGTDRASYVAAEYDDRRAHENRMHAVAAARAQPAAAPDLDADQKWIDAGCPAAASVKKDKP